MELIVFIYLFTFEDKICPTCWEIWDCCWYVSPQPSHGNKHAPYKGTKISQFPDFWSTKASRCLKSPFIRSSPCSQHTPTQTCTHVITIITIPCPNISNISEPKLTLDLLTAPQTWFWDLLLLTVTLIKFTVRVSCHKNVSISCRFVQVHLIEWFDYLYMAYISLSMVKNVNKEVLLRIPIPHIWVGWSARYKILQVPDNKCLGARKNPKQSPEQEQRTTALAIAPRKSGFTAVLSWGNKPKWCCFSK